MSVRASTAKWIASHICKHDKVAGASVESPNRVRVVRRVGDEIIVGCLSLERIEKDDVERLCDEGPIDFVVNIPKEAVINGDAIFFADLRRVGLGNMGDLFRALQMDRPADYCEPRMGFVLRGLRQHKRVLVCRQLNNRTIQVVRDGLPEVNVLVLDDYEVSSDVVRSAIEKFGSADAILCANPNATITDAGHLAASAVDGRIWKWKEFYGELNRRWK